MTKKWCMLSPWTCKWHRNDKTKKWCMSPWAFKMNLRWEKWPKSGACCHHGFVNEIAVTKTKKLCLSPWAFKMYPRREKWPNHGASCHHGLVNGIAVTKLKSGACHYGLLKWNRGEKNDKKWCMLSPWACKWHRGDKTKMWCMSPWAFKMKPWWEKWPKSGACCHHGLVNETAVTKTKKWCMSSFAFKMKPRWEKWQKVVHAVTVGL